MEGWPAVRDRKPDVATGLRWAHFHRDHREPGSHPIRAEPQQVL